MTWTRLKRGNDWGVDYFYHPDRPKSPMGTYSKSSGVPFTEGQPIRVRWPDGTESSEIVRHQTRHQTVGDMGKSYDVSFQLAGFETRTHGVTHWLALDDVDVWLDGAGQKGGPDGR